MNLTDIRAYFQRGKTKACRAERSERGGALGWLCTLPHDHDGSRHVAHDLDGTVITTWTSEPVIRPGEPT